MRGAAPKSRSREGLELLRQKQLQTSAGPTRRPLGGYAWLLGRSVVAVAALSFCWLPCAPAASARADLAALTPSGTEIAMTYDLYDIACEPTTDTCVAVGDGPVVRDGLAVGVVVSITNGVAGKPQPVPAADVLRSVACPSASECVAVGVHPGAAVANSHASGLYVDIHVGHPSRPVIVPSATTLDAVSCTAPGDCIATGDNLVNQGIVLRVGGTMEHAPKVVHGLPQLDAIACETASQCVAEGTVGQPGYYEGGVVDIVDGVPGPLQVLPGATLYGIACPSASTCEGIGENVGTIGQYAQGAVVPIVDGAPRRPALVERTGAGKWPEFWYRAIGCRRASLCEAVGYNNDVESTVFRGVFVSIRNGAPGAYAVMSKGTQLAGVACPGQTTCVAVGTRWGRTIASSKGVFLVLHFGG